MPGLVLRIGFLLWSVATVFAATPLVGAQTDEAAIRALVEQYYQHYAQQDVNGMLRLWSEQAPAYKTLKADFGRETSGATITYKSVRFDQWQSESDAVVVRAMIELVWKDSPTASAAPRRLVQILRLVREAGQWKVWQNNSLYEEVAARIDRATSDDERLRLFQQESELTPNDLVTAIYRVAFQYNSRGKYAEALPNVQFALTMAERLPHPIMIPRCLNLLGILHYAQGRFEPALNAFQRAVPLLEQFGLKSSAASTISNIGGIYYSQGEYEQAMEYFRRSLRLQEELGNQAAISAALTNIGAIYVNTGYYAEGIQHLERSLKIREELKQTTGVSSILSNLGTAYNAQGRTADALGYYLRNLKLQKELGNQPESINSQLNVALIHNELGRYDQAMVYAQAGLQLTEQLKLEEKRIYALNVVGEIYYWQKKYDAALSTLQQSLELQEKVGTKAYQGAALNLIASVYQEQQQFPAALETFQRALQAHQVTNNRLGVVLTQNDLGDVQHALRQYETALETFTRTESLARELNSPSALINAFEGQGKALRALNRLDEARQAYQNAVRVIEELGLQIGAELEQRLGFQQSHASPYFALTDLLLTQQKSQQAFAFAEQAKGRVLLDSLQNGRVSIAKLLAPEERLAEAKARARLSALNVQLTQAAQEVRPNNTKLARLKSQQIEARQTYESLQTQLYAAHPELKVRRGETAPLTLTEASALLNAQTALLEFAVGEEQSHLFVITLRNGQPALQTFTLPRKRNDLIAQTEQLRKYLSEKDLRYNQPARELYDLLLKPAAAQLQGKTRLIIVPDGPLWELPWQALMPAPNRFLVEEKTISTAPSLTFLREMMRTREQRKTMGKATGATTILAVGNPALGSAEMLAQRAELMGDQLAPLPFAEQQAIQLGQLYKTNAKVLLGAAASESVVKTEMSKHRILHLATHGVLDDRNPMYSHLVLAQTNVSEKEDGLLEARELLEMELQADLAVLSACETGRGKIGAGEGMIGLTWALFVAGVPSTVVSHWKVADKSTAELMVAFHQQLQAKQPKAEALRRAALQMLKQPNYRHPFHWAGFTLVGDGN